MQLNKILFDSHTHLNEERYTAAEREELAKKIEDSEVAYVVDIGFDLFSSNVAVKDAEKYDWCYAAVGVHPHSAESFDEETLLLIKAMAQNKKVVAIGEIGMDFHYEGYDEHAQQECFRAQIRLANELKLPIVIHSRDTDQIVMDILCEEGAFSDMRKAFFPKQVLSDGTLRDDARVLLHCYSGSSELAKRYVKLGGTISMAGPLTYKKAVKNVKVVSEIPMDYLLVETDAPYLTPEPFRGKPNMSPYVKYTVEKMAQIKGLSFEEVAEITMNNAKRFFGIKE
ncbi:MAG: TatD family hydrolase [Eubacteriales bacterium]